MEMAAIKTITPEADPATTPVLDVFPEPEAWLAGAAVVVAGGGAVVVAVK